MVLFSRMAPEAKFWRLVGRPTEKGCLPGPRQSLKWRGEVRTPAQIAFWLSHPEWIPGPLKGCAPSCANAAHHEPASADWRKLALARAPGSKRAVAKRFGVSRSTVGRARAWAANAATGEPGTLAGPKEGAAASTSTQSERTTPQPSVSEPVSPSSDPHEGADRQAEFEVAL